MKLTLLLITVAGLAAGQTSNRAAIRATGQVEPSGDVVYSVYVASGQEDLEGLTVSAALPPGTRYLESVHKPIESTYEGVKSDTVSWKIAGLERDTLLGPFTFRVRADGTENGLPTSIRAAVAYERPIPEIVESPLPEGRLIPLADSASVSFDQRGTLDSSGRNNPVAVGDTGIMLFIPEGAVTQRVTLTFTRLNVAENKLPATDPATWWCSLYKVTSEPQVGFSKEISIALPSRRALTPGLETSAFATADLENWRKVGGPAPAAEKTDPARAIGFGAPSQNQTFVCISQFGFTTCRVIATGGLGGFGAFGYIEQDNLKSKVPGRTIGSTAVGAITNPPSIIAILIGAR